MTEEDVRVFREIDTMIEYYSKELENMNESCNWNNKNLSELPIAERTVVRVARLIFQLYKDFISSLNGLKRLEA